MNLVPRLRLQGGDPGLPTFLKVNCAAIPGERLESELCGHEKGAFTGAHRRKLGQFELAHQNTIYLDESASDYSPWRRSSFTYSRISGSHESVATPRSTWTRG